MIKWDMMKEQRNVQAYFYAYTDLAIGIKNSTYRSIYHKNWEQAEVIQLGGIIYVHFF